MPKVFCSWSGGKDSCLACYLGVNNGLEVQYLANTVTEDGQRSCSHGISAEVIRLQAQAMGIPILQRPTTMNTYETEFISMLRAFKREGIEGGIFGDIDFNPHREWIETVCQAAGVTPHLPLWGKNQGTIMRDFISLGFESVVVAARADLFGDEILGRTVDLDFLDYLEELGRTRDITPCGEAGEYHTMVIDGPLFKKRVNILETSNELREGKWFLEIIKADLSNKQQVVIQGVRTWLK
ncbi:diphthine--ammonia ligase [Chloroflexota bacterium]